MTFPVSAPSQRLPLPLIWAVAAIVLMLLRFYPTGSFPDAACADGTRAPTFRSFGLPMTTLEWTHGCSLWPQIDSLGLLVNMALALGFPGLLTWFVALRRRGAPTGRLLLRSSTMLGALLPLPVYMYLYQEDFLACGNRDWCGVGFVMFGVPSLAIMVLAALLAAVQWRRVSPLFRVLGIAPALVGLFMVVSVLVSADSAARWVLALTALLFLALLVWTALRRERD